MADEQNANRDRKGKRRHFYTRKGKEGPAQPAPSAPEQRPAESRGSMRRLRKARRRSRSRQRAADEAKLTNGTEIETDYKAPQAVFIYTFATHPELRDAYEFRPEHFSRVGHKLDDYTIDISSLFRGQEIGPDGLPLLAESMPKPDYNWEEWEE